MKISFRLLLVIFGGAILLTSCASKKRKGKEPSALNKFYHNTTAEFNGYFNASEILKETYLKLEASHQDNFNEILPLYDYTTLGAAKSVEGELDRAIEKVTTVALLHEPSSWVDDCYVLMGEAQYLKQDYETAEETFEYFKEEFDPGNPFGRNYQKKKVSKKALKKAREKEKKEQAKIKKEEKKLKQKEREEVKKQREAERKQKAKEREEEQKRRNKEKKERAKKKKSSKKSSRGKKRRPKKEEPVEKEPEVKKEEPKVVLPKKTAEDRAREQAEIEAEEAEEPTEEYTPEKPKKKKIDKTAYTQGMLWLARTYVHRDKLSTAKYLINKMKNDGSAPKDVRREFPVVLADIYIKEKNYEEAISHLDDAIEVTGSKRKKARYAFVAGQLANRIGKQQRAGEYFAKAKKWTNDFQMEFMAELNAEKSSMIGGGKSRDAVVNKLDKMIKERKYEGYLDQLYYTKGEILLEDNLNKEAIAAFRSSNQNNTSNTPLKVETYYKLANLFYESENYIEAKYHFDSTLAVIDTEDRRYTTTKALSENLTEIATHITTIQLQDSLIGMAKKSDDEIREIAEAMVDKGIKAASTRQAPKRKSNLITQSRIGNRSNYWAYNQQKRQRHAADFKDTWGDIQLQDDWRRKDKQSIFGEEELAAAEAQDAEEQRQEAIDKMVLDIKKTLPYSPQQKSEAYALISNALFELGKEYRIKLQNYDKAVDAHEELIKRFDGADKKLETYYYLYLSNLDKPNQARADFYKEKLMTQFPDSEYAKVISNPAYAESIKSEEQELEEYYRDTYAAFNAGDYKEAYEKSKDTDQKFGKNNPLKPKFSLLNAMALGSIQGKDIYVKALRDVIGKHPNTPEKARAEEIIRFLQGDSGAFDNASMEEVDDIFSVEDNLRHYVAVVMYKTIPANFQEALVAVSNYNKKEHADKRLQLSDSSLDKEEKKDIILIRKFKNKAEAMIYYNKAVGDGNDFLSSDLGGYALYAITQRNYRKMVIEKSDSRYRQFFDKYYLEK